MDKRRLFFALEIHSVWPENFPNGRILKEKDRHLTLVFLGNVDYEKLSLNQLPLPKFRVGFAGKFDQLLFLTNVASYHVSFLENTLPLSLYHKELNDFFKLKEKSFLPHVTVARAPQELKEWKKQFTVLPLFTSNLHLYESLGHCQYEPIWTHKILPAFEEIEHTADIGFLIHAETLEQLYTHAFTALCFPFPSLLNYEKKIVPHSIEEIIETLNEMIAKADGEIGCPFKAVSYHGKLVRDDLLKWEMIIDV